MEGIVIVGVGWVVVGRGVVGAGEGPGVGVGVGSEMLEGGLVGERTGSSAD